MSDAIPVDYFTKLHDAEAIAHNATPPDFDTLDAITAFKKEYYFLLRLLEAVQNNPHRAIDGGTGAAAISGKSRAGIYKFLKRIKLTPDHFRRGNVTPRELIEQSDTLRKAYTSIMVA